MAKDQETMVADMVDLRGVGTDVRGFVRSAVSQYWWLSLLRGVLAIVVGIIALARPGIALGTLVILTAVLLIGDGIVSFIRAFTGGVPGGQRVLWGLLGAVSIAAGIIVFRRPGGTAVALSLLLAVWLIVMGTAEFVAGLLESDGRWFRLIMGALSVMVGISLLVNPIDAVLTLVFVFGFTFLFMGMVEIAAAIELRSVAKNAGDREEIGEDNV